ncbi:MAG: hypothetical protein HQL09_05830 [Nitrospirae bacterium]|nr:hypothetical protein [Nitrospirota bacterium]
MNHMIEQLVKDFRHHQQALESFGSLAVEVYIAYLLEKVIDHFHEKIGRLFRDVWTKLIPTLIEKVKKIAQSLRKKVGILIRIVQK